MKLWLISQDVNGGYDTFDSVVVAAEDEEAARLIHPSRKEWPKKPERVIGKDWADYPHQVQVECIGEAADDIEAGTIILSSYNAG